MAQVVQWSGIRHLRTRADERLELAARRRALAETCGLEALLLDAFVEYHDWVTTEWAAARDDSGYTEYGAGIYRSGDDEDPNWLAYVTGGAIAFLKACHHVYVAAHEFAGCAHYLCNVSYDWRRAYALQEQVRRITRRASASCDAYKRPITGLVGLGRDRAAWWLTQPRRKQPRRRDDQLSIEGTVLRLVVDADRAHRDAQRLRIHLLNRKQPEDTPALLRRNSKRAWQQARQRELKEPASYAALLRDAKLFLPVRRCEPPLMHPDDLFRT